MILIIDFGTVKRLLPSPPKSNPQPTTSTFGRRIRTSSSEEFARAEYAEVYDRYYNTDQWMKAPNGEWSNLNEQQWVTVRTPSFLNWFGNWIDDPKSVELSLDENGEPEVFYHGSYTDDIEIFKIQPRLGYYNSRNRGGFSFTNNREKAESYAVPQQKRVKAISNYLRELRGH